jgi:ribonuclease HI
MTVTGRTADATIHIDGAARGNPGPAAYALILVRPGHPPLEEAQPIGQATNNVAEYTALIRALQRAAELGLRSVEVLSDSELIVKQMTGEYKVKNADMRELHREAQALCQRFDRVTLSHIRRADNKRADLLCNEALDGRPVRWGQAADTAPRPEPRSTPSKRMLLPADRGPDRLAEEAVALLNAVRTQWASGSESPAAVEVWDRLWAMLKDHDLLK